MALISPKQVTQKYGVPTDELARWRRAGTGPEYYRIAPRVIRYGTDDIDEWFRDPLNAPTRCSDEKGHAGMRNLLRIVTTES